MEHTIMKIAEDYTVETKMRILRGPYKGVLVEFGNYAVSSVDDSTKLHFDYTIHEKPENLQNVTLLNNPDFEKCLYEIFKNYKEFLDE